MEQLARITAVRFEWLATGRGAIGYETADEDVPAAEAEFVYDPTERRLLAAFRGCDAQTRRMLMRLAEAPSPEGRRSA
ncbi:MAG TPA: hypothetical protein VFF91_01485 [Pseudoxanthomonas sp.]|nr:hypothetical protein [Pseudoxanthomonas sp.]